jgi:hypothetical protein
MFCRDAVAFSSVALSFGVAAISIYSVLQARGKLLKISVNTLLFYPASLTAAPRIRFAFSYGRVRC